MIRVIGSVAILLFQSFAVAEAANQSKAEGLVLRLSLPESCICVGQRTLAVEVEIRNLGTQTIRFIPDGIGTFIHFQVYESSGRAARGEIDGGLHTIIDFWPWARAQRIVELAAGRSHRTSLTLPLDPKYFSEPGIYKVRIDFEGRAKLPPRGAGKDIFEGNLTSNWVYFEVQDCETSGEE